MGERVARARRRGRGEGSIYKDEAKGRWYAAVSVGYGPDGKTWRRHKISGRTRAEVAAKLRELQAEQDSGAQSAPGYTVQRAVDDWLAEGLDGRSARTVTLNRHVLKPVTAIIGDIELRKLTAHDVRRALTQLARDHSSRTVVIAHNALTRALRYPEGPGRQEEQGTDRRAGRRPTEGRRTSQARRLCRPLPADRHPHGGGPGASLGSRGPRCGDRRGMAIGASRRRYQDCEVTPDPWTAPRGW
jgi:hypothetical protein